MSDPLDLKEVVARALCINAGKNPDDPFRDRYGKAMDFPEWKRWTAEASAAIAPIRDLSRIMSGIDLIAVLENSIEGSDQRGFCWEFHPGKPGYDWTIRRVLL